MNAPPGSALAVKRAAQVGAPIQETQPVNIFQDVIDFLEGQAQNNPAAAAAAADVKTAATSVEAAVDPIADAILNAALERVPIIGGLLTGPADAILNSFLDKLLGKFEGGASTALARIAPAAQATMAPIPNP